MKNPPVPPRPICAPREPVRHLGGLVLLVAVCLTSQPASAATPTETVRNAIERLSAADNYSFNRGESTDPTNVFALSSTGPIHPNFARISRDGRMDISSRLQEAIIGSPIFRILLVGTNGVIRFQELERTGQPWISLAEIDSATPEKMRLLAALPTAPWYDQWLRSGTLQRRLTAAVRNIRPPTVGAADLLGKLGEVRGTPGRYEGTLVKAKALEWLTSEGYSADTNNPLNITNCSTAFWIANGMLSKYELDAKGTRPTYYGAVYAPSVRYVPFSLMLTVEIFDVGKSPIEAPAEAAKKLPQLLPPSSP